jgi:hypothetical protein
MSVLLAFLALLFERALGYPQRLVDAIGHPVTWIGALIAWLDKRWNRESDDPVARRRAGFRALLVILAAAILPAMVLQWALGWQWIGLILLATVFGYIATGVWHHYVIYRDMRWLRQMWPVVRKAIDFVCNLQSRHGEIYWAQDHNGVSRDALLTGCSSLYKSLECAALIAARLGTTTSAVCYRVYYRKRFPNRKRRVQLWTDDRVAGLIDLWNDGCTARIIAEILGPGFNRNMVIGKAHRLGLRPRPSPIKRQKPTTDPWQPQARGCEWISGEPTDPPCGKQRIRHQPYCEAHLLLSVRKDLRDGLARRLCGEREAA